MSNEYIGSIILMVYLGAIIIFFVFILFSSDPKKFSVIYFDTSFIRSINFSFIFIFFIYFSLFYFSLRRLILPYYKNSIIANKDVFNSDKSVTQVIGDIIFNFYSHHVSILGVLLLIALFGSLKMINPKKKKNKFIFKKKSKFTFKKKLTK
jgi:NADH:ubiquinone oxidoreductase subunit 6 (subunit J)